MGKPYTQEIARLGETYDWTMRQDVSLLADAFSAIADSPVIAVGSGGSLSAAVFAADLHEESTGCIAKAVTPLGPCSGIIRSMSRLGSNRGFGR